MTEPKTQTPEEKAIAAAKAQLAAGTGISDAERERQVAAAKAAAADSNKAQPAEVAAAGDTSKPVMTSGDEAPTDVGLVHPEVKKAYGVLRSDIDKLQYLWPHVADKAGLKASIERQQAEFKRLDDAFGGMNEAQQKAAITGIKASGKTFDEKTLDPAIKDAIQVAQKAADKAAYEAKVHENQENLEASNKANEKIAALVKKYPELKGKLAPASPDNPKLTSMIQSGAATLTEIGIVGTQKGKEVVGGIGKTAGEGFDTIKDAATNPKGFWEGIKDAFKRFGDSFTKDGAGGRIAGAVSFLAGAFGISSMFGGPIRWGIFALLAVPALMMGTSPKVGGWFNDLFAGVANGFKGKAGPGQNVSKAPELPQAPVKAESRDVNQSQPEMSFAEQVYWAEQGRRMEVQDVRHAPDSYSPPRQHHNALPSMSVRGDGFTYRN